MRPERSRGALTIVAMMLASTILLGGCVLTRHTESLPKTNLQELEDDMRKAESQVEATSDSILELQAGQEFEIRELFADYLATAELMDRSRDQLNRHLEQLRVQGLDYFTEWAKHHNGSYANPKIRMLTPEQVNDLSQQFDTIPEEAEKARRALAPFAFDVDQLRDMAPISQRKIDYLDFLFEKAQNDADSLTDALQQVLQQIGQARAQLAQIEVPPQGKGKMEQMAPGALIQPAAEVGTAPIPAPPPEVGAAPIPAPTPEEGAAPLPAPASEEGAAPPPAPAFEEGAAPLPPPPPTPGAIEQPGRRRMEQR